MTWDESLGHMENLGEGGAGELKGWNVQASALQTSTMSDMQRRIQVQNKLAGVCEAVPKELGARPKCSPCPKPGAPDSSPGVTTSDALVHPMPNLLHCGAGQRNV